MAAQLGAPVVVKVKVALPPAVVPVTVLPLTVAAAVLLLTHVPPLEGDKVVVVPPQKEVGPVTETTGNEDTVNACWADAVPHPPLIEYLMLQVPAANAVTRPDEFTVATAVLSLLQLPVPPPVTTLLALLVAVAPLQSAEVPVTEAMLALGVTV